MFNRQTLNGFLQRKYIEDLFRWPMKIIKKKLGNKLFIEF